MLGRGVQSDYLLEESRDSLSLCHMLEPKHMPIINMYIYIYVYVYMYSYTHTTLIINGLMAVYFLNLTEHSETQ